MKADLVAYTEQKACRLCGGSLSLIADFGAMALTSVFPKAHEDDLDIPMTLRKCTECELVQLGENTNPALMYREGYGYRSGINESMVKHLTDIVAKGRPYLPDGGMVLDIGCNDGTLLRLWGREVARRGYDPIGELVYGADIVREYFSYHGAKYDVITSIAMFYDIPDPLQFAGDVAESLTKDGAWILEVGYAGALYDGMWDGVCHEHLTYYGVKQIDLIASKVGMYIEHIEFNDVNGQSLLCVLRKGKRDKTAEVINAIEQEKLWGWSKIGEQIDAAAKALHDFVAKDGRKIYALGASTKGNVILQHAKLRGLVSAAIDRNPQKVGRFTPGTRIPIKSEEWARENPPDAFLVLPYHFRDGLLAREAELRAKGVKFIFPLPVLEEV